MVILIVWVSSFLLLSLLIMLFSQKLLSKEEWTSDLWIVEMSKKWLLLLWLVYFMVRLIRLSDEGLFDSLEQRALAMVNYFKMLIGVNAFWEPLDILLGLTVTWMTYSLIYKGIKAYGKYELLSPQEFPEYDFPFQRDLVKFLNSEPKFGQNTYWLDGGWGTGKTHFLRTFFKEQEHKELEIYYVSCFGIKTREQAEQVLIREIEDRSSFGSLDHIPVVGSLIKWGVTTLGLNLMKKDSVVIFDDLERVTYPEKEDKSQDYNDLLGFIDYLANHKNQKVIVVYNSKEIPNTQRDIIGEKFSAIVNRIPSVDDVVELLTSYNDLEVEDANYKIRVLFILKFLEKIYKIRYRALGRANFRQLYQEIEKYTGDDIIMDEIEEVIISSLNSIASSKYFQFMCEEISRFLDYDVSNPYGLPPINEIDVRLIDGIKTSVLYDFWGQHQELFEFLMEYAYDYPILSDIKIVTIEDDRYIYEFPKDYDFYIDLG